MSLGPGILRLVASTVPSSLQRQTEANVLHLYPLPNTTGVILVRAYSTSAHGEGNENGLHLLVVETDTKGLVRIDQEKPWLPPDATRQGAIDRYCYMEMRINGVVYTNNADRGKDTPNRRFVADADLLLRWWNAEATDEEVINAADPVSYNAILAEAREQLRRSEETLEHMTEEFTDKKAEMHALQQRLMNLIMTVNDLQPPTLQNWLRHPLANLRALWRFHRAIGPCLNGMNRLAGHPTQTHPTR
ncbi:hypothetical protein HY933_01295 [Candidatus Falkowbacteria bacterium]|nr:hypothetical protein [Candidatus Falkowbacteria bacterium]